MQSNLSWQIKANENISIKCNGEIITDTTKPSDIFNARCINYVEKSSGTPPNIKGNPENLLEDSITVKNLFKEYKNYPRIIDIKNQNLAKRSYEVDFATTNQINKMIKEVDPKKAADPDKVPPKIIKLSANVIGSHLTKIINSDIEKNAFSEGAKTVSLRPIVKKNEREKVENYKPLSIPNCFSKIYEKHILEQFKPFLNDFLSRYMATYISSTLHFKPCFNKADRTLEKRSWWNFVAGIIPMKSVWLYSSWFVNGKATCIRV